MHVNNRCNKEDDEKVKEQVRRKHDPSRWHLKLWRYYPINFDPNEYHKITSWWLDKIPKLGNKIMEVGCHSGLALVWLKLNFPEKDIIGIDINDFVCHAARTRMYFFSVDIPIYQGDGISLFGFKDQSKDIIFSEGLLEHYDENERLVLLREHLRIAKYVLVVVPTDKALKEGGEYDKEKDLGGYGDEVFLSYESWSEFMNKYFKVKEEFSKDNKYCCVLEGLK